MSEKQYVDFRYKLEKLLDTIRLGKIDQIDKAKLECLWEAGDLFEIVFNYLFLNKLNIHFDFGSSVIKKGTKLYRIRDTKIIPIFQIPKNGLRRRIKIRTELMLKDKLRFIWEAKKLFAILKLI